MFKTFLLCSLCWTIVTYSETHVEQFIGATLENLCPGVNYCQNRGLDDWNDDQRSCCIQCTCDDTCPQLGTCCPDKDRSSDDKPELPCIGTDIKSVPGRTADKSYRIINECPHTEENEELARNCSSTKLMSTENAIWISDIQTGTIYQNRFCAMCHGVDTYVYWSVASECPEVIKQDYTLDIGNILNDCSEIILEAPDAAADMVSKYRCFPPDYSACNTTGLWKTYNESIDSACRSFSMVYFKEGRKSTRQVTKVFRNVYCYMCNFNAEIKNVPKVCPAIDELFSRSDARPRFSVLLDVNKYLSERSDDEKDTCQENEIFDPYLKICHRLDCPFGNMLIKGKCEKMVSRATGFAIRASYRLKVSEQMTSVNFQNSSNETDDQQRIELGLAVHKKFKKLLNFDDGSCQICTEHMQTLSINESIHRGGYHMMIRMSTLADCQVDTIFMKFLGVLGKLFTVRKHPYGYLTLKVELDKESYTKIGPNPSTVMFAEGFAVCVFNLQLKSDEICPKIELKYEKILNAPRSRARSSALSLFEEEENARNDTVLEMCVKKYFAFMTVNSQMSCTWSQTVVIIYCIMLTCLCDTLRFVWL